MREKRLLVGIYAVNNKKIPEGELHGNPDSLLKLAADLSSEKLPLECSLDVRHDESTYPYDDFLSGYQIINDTEPIQVKLEGSTLVIMGSLETRKNLASRIEWLARSAIMPDDRGRHIHLDDYPCKDYLSPKSRIKSLVFVLRD